MVSTMTEVATEENQVVLNNEMEEGDEEVAKKETFQWNTPADEFAEDVASDVEEESEDENAGAENNRSAGNNQVVEATHFSEVTNGQVDVKPLKPKSEGSGKKAKAKNQFPCPKCNKVWNWPWELRRHLVMHFKEVLLILGMSQQVLNMNLAKISKSFFDYIPTKDCRSHFI